MKYSTKTKRVSRTIAVVMIGIILCGITTIFLHQQFIKTSEASWFNDAYAYRQQISFTHNAAISSERRITITISGTNTLNTDGKLQADCDDIRFTDSNGKELDFQNTGICPHATLSTFEVVFPSIINGTNIGYLYYGNPSATSKSQDVSAITSLTPSGSPSAASEETQASPVLHLALDEGYGTTTYDTIGRGTTGSISGATWRSEEYCISAKCLLFDGSNDVVTGSATLTNIKTISFWVRLPVTSSTQELIDLNGSAYITSTSPGTITTTGFTSPTIYIDGKTATSITANRWHHVAVTTATGLSASALKLGQISTNYGQMFMDEFQLYSSELSASQVKSLYNSRGGNPSSLQFGTNEQKNLSDGLVGYWKEDETSNGASPSDSSGNETTLTDAATVTRVAGKFGNAGDFESGSSQYQYVADNTTLSITGSLTISVWIKPESVSAGTWNIVGKWDGSNESYRLYQSTNQIVLEIESGNTITSTTTLTAGTWYHIVGSYDSTTQIAKLYINGTPETATSSGTIPSSIGDDAGAFQIGAEDRNNTPKNFYDGIIDEVRMYNRALSSLEIQQLHKWSPGPIAYWKMDENTGTTTNDSSGNGSVSSTFVGNTSWIRGRFGSGLFFDGTDDNIRIVENTSTDIGALQDSHTIGAWFKTSANYSSTGQILGKASNTLTYPFSLYMTSTETVCYTIADGTFFPSACTTETYNDGQWHYATAVRNTSTDTLYLYIDGILKVTATDTTTGSNVNNDDIVIGNGGTSYTLYDFSGSIDDVKLYKYVRTPSQIIQDMNADHPLVGTPVAGPVAHWSFDEGYSTTANDQTPNNNDLTLSTASWTNSGKFYKAWDGGDNKRLSRADDADFDFLGTDDFTISAWIYYAAQGNEYIISKRSGNTGYELYGADDGFLFFNIGDTGSVTFPENTLNNSAAMTINNWYHIAIVKEGTTQMKMYVNGVLDSTLSGFSATGSLANSGTLYVGDANNTNDTDEWNGDIDELKIYRAALTQSEILADMNHGKSLVLGSTGTTSTNIPDNSASREYCVPGDATSCTAPIHEYTFTEATGTTVYDTGTATTRNGTLTLGPTFTTGKYGKGILFDGADSYISFSSNELYDETQAFTISAWINPTTLASVDNPIICASSYNNSCLYTSTQGAFTNALVYCADGSCATTASSKDNTITTNTWQFITMTYDGTNICHFYVNGILATNDSSCGETSGTHDMLIGGTSTPADSFRGKIDQFRTYNYIRTPSQIAWDYNKGKPVAHWQFDELSGTTAYDNGGNSLTGTLTNTPTRTTSGKFNSAIDFDGADDYVTVTNASSIDGNEALQNGLSITGWIYADTDGEGDVGQFFSKGTETFCRTDSQSGSILDIQCELDLSTDATLNIASAITTGTWNHIAMIWENDADDEISIYINGTNRGTSTDGVGPYSTDTSNFLIGNNSATDSSFDGKIDDVRIYNYPLTNEQIKLIINDGSSTKF